MPSTGKGNTGNTPTKEQCKATTRQYSIGQKSCFREPVMFDLDYSDHAENRICFTCCLVEVRCVALPCGPCASVETENPASPDAGASECMVPWKAALSWSSRIRRCRHQSKMFCANRLCPTAGHSFKWPRRKAWWAFNTAANFTFEDRTAENALNHRFLP